MKSLWNMEYGDIILVVVTSVFLVYNVNTYHTGHHFSEPIDLTWYFDNYTVYWPGGQPFVFTKKTAQYMNVLGTQHWEAFNDFCAAEHGGTHIDAPYHFNREGKKLGDIPIKNLIVPGVVIDISAEVEHHGPNTKLEPHHIATWELIHGPISSGVLVLVKLGWAKYYSNQSLYLGPNYLTGNLSFPGISGEAAAWLAEKAVVGVGVDTASIDPGNSLVFPAHQILTAHNIYLIENIKLLYDLPPRGFTLLALPMNIAEGTGGPLRLVAVPPGYIK